MRTCDYNDVGMVVCLALIALLLVVLHRIA
jgi:hypothetical protein